MKISIYFDESRETGAIAPQFLLVLLFVSALSLGAGLFVSSILNTERRALQHDSQRKEMSRILEAVLKDLRSDQTPETDGTDDPVWAWNKKSDNGYTVSIRSLSSSLNPNFIRKDLVERTAIKNLFKDGKTVADLQQYREESGLSLSDTAYQNFFDTDNYTKYFSQYGWMNINLVDEFAAGSLITSITGVESTGNSFRGKIQLLLVFQTIVERSGLKEILGPDYGELFPYINAEPLMNVNFVDPFVLKEILSYPENKLATPDAKADALLALRATGGANTNDIQNILGIDKANRLFYYFGCVTWFWEIRIQGKGERCIAVVCRYPQEDLSVSKLPLFRTIELRYEK